MLIDADWYADWYANWCSLVCWFMLIDSDWCSYKVQPSFILSEHTSGAFLVILDLSGALYKPLCNYWSGNHFLNFYIATQWTWRQSSKSGRRRQTRSLQFNYNMTERTHIPRHPCWNSLGFLSNTSSLTLWALLGSRDSCVCMFESKTMRECADIFPTVVCWLVPRKKIALLTFRAVFLAFLPGVRLFFVFRANVFVIQKPSVEIIYSMLYTVVFAFFCIVVGWLGWRFWQSKNNSFWSATAALGHTPE